MASFNDPKHCDPTAYLWFEEHLPRLETTAGLLGAAVAISRHSLKDASVIRVRQTISEIANQVSSRVRSRALPAVLAHLHDVLFEELGFRGNVADYYNPRNSLLPVVLTSRVGIPISLSLIYKAVAHELEIDVVGINTPVHFLARIVGDGGDEFVDAYQEGRLLTRDEARQHLEKLVGASLPVDDQLFAVATHAAWISRMLRNLQYAYAMRGDLSDAQAMQELESRLQLKSSR